MQQSVTLSESCSVDKFTRKGKGEPSLYNKGEGQGRGEESGNAASMNSSA